MEMISSFRNLKKKSNWNSWVQTSYSNDKYGQSKQPSHKHHSISSNGYKEKWGTKNEPSYKYLDKKRKSVNETKNLKITTVSKTPISVFDPTALVYRSSTPIERYRQPISSKNADLNRYLSPSDMRHQSAFDHFTFDSAQKWQKTSNQLSKYR